MKTQAYIVIQDDQGGEVRLPLNASLQVAPQAGAHTLAAAALAAEAVAVARTPTQKPAPAPKRVYKEWSPEIRNLALRLIERGETISSVAAMLGASYNTVWQWTYATSRTKREVAIRSKSVTVTVS